MTDISRSIDEINNLSNKSVSILDVESPGHCIIHAIDTTGPGGAETIFINMVEKLKTPGCRNLAVIKGPGWVEDQLRARNIDYRIIKPRGFLSIPYYWQLVKLVRNDRVVLVQAHLLGSSLSYSIVSLIARIPLVATLHGQVDIDPSERFVWIKQKILRIGVNKLIAVSRDLARYIQSRGLFYERDIDVIYNGINADLYQIPDSGMLRRKIGISHSTTLIGALGNIRPAKSYETLIRVAAELESEDIAIVIAGHQRQDLMVSLNQLAMQLGVTGRVHFLGFQDNTPEFLSQLDIFVLCSQSEGFSIATIEALAAGLPVVATRCGGPEEILDDGVSGVLVPVGQPKLMANAIKQLINNPKMCDSLAGRGLVSVKDHFSQESMLNAYQKCYENLLMGRSGLATFNRYIKNRFGSKLGFLRFVRGEFKRLSGEYRKFENIDFKRVKRLVFVCHGNICRSPLGEAVVRKSEVACYSFGLSTKGGAPADPRARTWALANGYELESHKTRRMEEFVPLPGDLLIGMEPVHGERLISLYGKYQVQITLAGLWLPSPLAYIHDPYNSSSSYFSRCEKIVSISALELANRVRFK